jgi:hypothetical protein
MYMPGPGVRPFHFTRVLDDAADQRALYEQTVQPLVASALNGFNACVLCYGQTGSGKTYTMFGPDGALAAAREAVGGGAPVGRTSAGAVLRALEEVLEHARAANARSQRRLQLARAAAAAAPEGVAGSVEAHTVEVRLQYVEIYGSEITCLATGDAVRLRPAGATAAGAGAGAGAGGSSRTLSFELQGAAETPVTCMDEALRVLEAGHERKHFAATLMNERSSRAHTALVATITQTRRPVVAVAAASAVVAAVAAAVVTAAGGSGGGGGGGGDGGGEGGRSSSGVGSDGAVVLRSYLHLVDLAGCEQIKKSGAESGQRKREAVGINGSLLVLGRCISALSQRKSHVPYFESALTKLLMAAFGGNSRTATIVTASVDDEHAEETFNALKFGERCSMITNRAKFATTSVKAAVAAIDSALQACEAQVAGLEAKGHTHLPSYQRCKERLWGLRLKRSELGSSS